MGVERAVLIVFAKEPRPGQVKTRMSPPLRPDQAADLYSHLLDDVLEATERLSDELLLDAVLAVHPPEAVRRMASRVPASFRVVPQRGADLGQRMEWAAAQAAAQGAGRILLRGSDSPLLDSGIVGAALRALDSNDVAISPDTDGGYSLVGMRSFVAGLFDHPMSTRTVLQDTQSVAASLNLKTAQLAASFDLDTADDLRFLVRACRGGYSELCSRTLTWLEENDAWRESGPANAGAKS